jgi:hypothetical protein
VLLAHVAAPSTVLEETASLGWLGFLHQLWLDASEDGVLDRPFQGCMDVLSRQGQIQEGH